MTFRSKVHCLEMGRNLRLCGGAEWYELEVLTLEAENINLKTALGRILEHSGYGGWDLQDAYAHARKVMDAVA